MNNNTRKWFKTRIWIIVVGIFLILGLGVLSVTENGLFNVGADISGSQVNDPRIGIHDYLVGSDYKKNVESFKKSNELGVGSAKIFTNWQWVQPQDDGNFDFTGIDHEVDAAKENNIEVYGMIQSNAEWAVAACADKTWRTAECTGKYSNVPKEGPDRDKDYYRNKYITFVETLVKKYPEIKYWMLGNEVDQQNFWGGTPQQYVELAKLTYPALKRANPSAQLVLGNFSGGPIRYLAFCDDIKATPEDDKVCFKDDGTRWNWDKPGTGTTPYRVKYIIENSTGYYDIIGIHPYIDISRLDRALSNFNLWAAKHGAAGKEIWADEFGGPLIEGTTVIDVEPNTDQEQSDQVIKRFTIAFGNNMTHAMWFVQSAMFCDPKLATYEACLKKKPKNDARALLRDDKDKTEKPAAKIFRYYAGVMKGFDRVSKTYEGNGMVLYKVTFQDQNKNPIWIAWSTDRNSRTVDLSSYLPKGPLTTATNISDETPGVPTTVAISSIPVFIYSQGDETQKAAHSYCINGKCSLQKGYNSVTTDNIISLDGFYEGGTVVFDFNQDGTKEWRKAYNENQSIISLNPGQGYYVYSPINQTISNTVLSAQGSLTSTTATVRRGWNIMANQSDQEQKLSDLSFYTLKQDSTANCIDLSCFSDISIAKNISRFYHKIVLIVDGTETDKAKALQYVEMRDIDLSTIKIPAHSTFWLYLWK